MASLCSQFNYVFAVLIFMPRLRSINFYQLGLFFFLQNLHELGPRPINQKKFFIQKINQKNQKNINNINVPFSSSFFIARFSVRVAGEVAQD